MSEALAIAIGVLILQEPVKDLYLLTKKVAQANKSKIAKWFSYVWAFVLPAVIILYYIQYKEFDKKFVIVIVVNSAAILLNIVFKLLAKVRERIFSEGIKWRDDTIALFKNNIRIKEEMTELSTYVGNLLKLQLVVLEEKVGKTQEETIQLDSERVKLESTLGRLKELEKNRPNIIRKITPGET